MSCFFCAFLENAFSCTGPCFSPLLGAYVSSLNFMNFLLGRPSPLGAPQEPPGTSFDDPLEGPGEPQCSPEAPQISVGALWGRPGDLLGTPWGRPGLLRGAPEHVADAPQTSQVSISARCALFQAPDSSTLKQTQSDLDQFSINPQSILNQPRINHQSTLDHHLNKPKSTLNQPLITSQSTRYQH
jgi:hypothetical protein